MLRKNLSTEEALIIHGAHGGNGSSDFIRNLNGYFGAARAQEILEEIFYEMLLRKKSLGGIFNNKIRPRARNNLSLK